jgi:PadR family transcriptional regulator, regulatory protein PadR
MRCGAEPRFHEQTLQAPVENRGLAKPASLAIYSAMSNKHEPEHLGELEHLVLLAVLQAGDDAYGVAVREEIRRRARRDLTLGTVYKTLTRLQAKGLVSARQGEPTAERGGRAKRYYSVSAAGRRVVRGTFVTLRRMSAGLGVGLDTP